MVGSLEYAVSMNLEITLREVINTVLLEDGLQKVDITSETQLGEIGLDSLGFAIVIARLEKVVGYDPFTEGKVNQYPSTFGEFLKIYQGFS
jgi:acyl carrier protein